MMPISIKLTTNDRFLGRILFLLLEHIFVCFKDISNCSWLYSIPVIDKISSI